MKLAALLVALSAAALAAPGAGKKGDAMTISKITYNSENVRAAGDSIKTEICLNDIHLEGVTESEKIYVSVSEEPNAEVMYQGQSNTDDCVTITAPMPEDRSTLQYALYVMRDPTKKAGVQFEFKEMKPGDKITCAGRNFKRTTLSGPPANTEVCLNTDSNEDGDYCYEEIVDNLLDEGCANTETVSGAQIQNCQKGVVDMQLTPSTDIEEDTAISLSYDAKLTLGDVTGTDDVIVVSDAADNIAQVPNLVEQDGKDTATLESFVSGPTTYTACPVMDGFTTYTITDLEIKGTYEAVNGQSKYYQFGFHLGTDHKKFVVSSENNPLPVTIDCANLSGDRCFGFLKSDDDSITLAYYDETDPQNPITSNSIIVSEGFFSKTDES